MGTGHRPICLSIFADTVAGSRLVC